ncbi:MAG: hypothetical protein JO131_09955 [Gammaproteobacteria bacterium]|nr:hypothetical protein [Gammaproteobacteria bacterium]
MPIMLKDYLSNLDKQFQLDASNGFLNLVIQAKLNGIKVVPIDTEASYHTPDLYLSDYKKDASGRHAMMNYEATRIIRGYEQTKKGKSIIFCGSGHLNQVTQTPGLRQLIGCTTIVLQTYEANNQQEKVISTPEHETKPDFMMYVNPTKSFANTLETKTSIKKIPATISLLSELLQELTKNYSPKNSLSQKKLDLLQTCDTILSNAKDESIVKKILPYIIAIALQKTAFHFKDKTTLGHNLRELLKNNKFKSISDMLKLDAKKIESKPDSPNHVTYEELRLLGNIQNEKNIKHFFSSKPELHLNHIQKQLEKMQEEIIQQKLNLDSHP